VSSAIRWVRAWRVEGRVTALLQGGDLRSHHIEVYRGVILGAIDADVDITLAELSELPHRKHGASFAPNTVWRFLDRHGRRCFRATMSGRPARWRALSYLLVRHRPSADPPWMKKFCVGGNSENVSPFFFLGEVCHLALELLNAEHTEHLTQTATRPDLAMAIDVDVALFVALELSLTSWVVVASERWPGSSEQRYAADKWIPCRLFPWIAVVGVTQGGRSPTGVMPTTAATFMLQLPLAEHRNRLGWACGHQGSNAAA
jgi:hypothetical protein